MNITLGKQLKIVREARGFSQWDLAVRTGLDRSRLSLIENGYIVPTSEQLAKIREALSWTPELDELVEKLAASPDADK